MTTKKINYQLIISNKMPAIYRNKSSILTINMETYAKRALIEISTNPKLLEITKTEIGIVSILAEITKAAGMGLQIGNQIPQAYLIPFNGRVALCPTAEGLRFIALSHPPVIKSFNIFHVFEGDEINIPTFTEITHVPKITKEKRVLVGIGARIVQLDDSFNNKFISRGDIEEIRWKWSPNPKGKAWENSYDMMAMAKAAKRFLSEYAAQSEGLRNALEVEEILDNQNPDIEKRTNEIIENVIDVSYDDMTEEKKQEPKKEKEKKTVEKVDEELDIFAEDNKDGK